LDAPPKELAAWRKKQRQNLIDQRMAVDPETLGRWQLAMDTHIAQWFPDIARKSVIAICWPHRNEHDARGLAAQWRAAGATIALPLAAAPGTPLAFRAWGEDTPLAQGPMGIPYPAQGEAVIPRVMLIPAVGFDAQGYRLGYGGGYFDRTLAAMKARPLVIATAYELSRMATLHPQPHDIPMDWVVTEAGVYRRGAAGLVQAKAR
jgi:5,10-methenyltetrahydrofolate synthetase